MKAMKVILVVAVLTTVSSCDKIMSTQEAQRTMSESTIRMAYSDVGVTVDDALVAKAADAVDRIPASLNLEDRFRCYYETMVVVDFARRHAGKSTFPETARQTDDDLSNKAAEDAILLSDQPFPAPPVAEAFLSAHVAEYAVPSDEEALFVHAVWRASDFRGIANAFGGSGLTGPKADKWLRKNRSPEPSDKLYRKRANLGIGERRCYSLLGKPLVPKQLQNVDAKKLAASLAQ